MASWASIANKSPQAPAEPSGIAATTQEKSCAVIDTNAIIDGSQLQLYGEQLATIPEVLAEVKDKKTRDFLERFPFQIQSLEPNPESLRAGKRARVHARIFRSRCCVHSVHIACTDSYSLLTIQAVSTACLEWILSS